MHEIFRRIADASAHAVGTPTAFLAALLVVLVWAGTGPVFHYSDTWQLLINTGTTVVTFLMVFLIQSTQDRDTRILNLKLDELIRAIEGARTGFVSLNELSDDDLEEVQRRFNALGERFNPLVGDDLAVVRGELERRRDSRRVGRDRRQPVA